MWGGQTRRVIFSPSQRAILSETDYLFSLASRDVTADLRNNGLLDLMNRGVRELQIEPIRECRLCLLSRCLKTHERKTASRRLELRAFSCKPKKRIEGVKQRRREAVVFQTRNPTGSCDARRGRLF